MPLTHEKPFAVFKGKLIKQGQLWSDVQEIAQQLPDRPYLFNLCENRYLFCLGLLAAVSRGQSCLLPPSEKKAVIKEIARDYPGVYIASDRASTLPELEWFTVKAPECETFESKISLNWERSSIIAFTSGSTGKPKPCVHTLATFRTSAKMAITSLGLSQQPWLMVATTPPQHMYGLETSIFWPLFSNLILYDDRPFFPEDIRRVIETAPVASVLVTTPTHLRALIQSKGSWEKLKYILSATDTLSAQLALETQATLEQSPHEIYGSTETLSFATRETLRESLWRPYANAQLIELETGRTCLKSPHLPTAVVLEDAVKIEADGRFTVLGRHNDLIKIGGKRMSLGELNQKLQDIDGVEDGFCFIQEEALTETRVTAIVISQLDKHSIQNKLRPYIDEVFLPRKIHFVTRIERNKAGKLTNSEMEKILRALSQ